MNISFDLDNTLIPHGNEFESERRNLLAKVLGVEFIRKDMPLLFSKLQQEGHQLHIYTTSFRSKIKIRFMLFCYGIKVGKIINQFQNERTLKRHNKNASKYSPAYGFDLHIDDSVGVGMEGERLGFATIIVSPKDENWIETILSSL